MGNYIGFRDGGKTNEEGFAKWLNQTFTGGFPLTNVPTSMQATQRGSGANMSVDVAAGNVHLPNPAASYSYWGWTDAVNNVTVATADPTNPRIDVLYVYVDLTVVSSASNNNPGALKFGIQAGTPAGSPTTPSDSTIQTALGASTPFQKIATITVAAAAPSITNAVISDVRATMALKVSTGAAATSGWNSLLNIPTSVTYNGNHSYTCVFNGVDLTSTLSTGMRFRSTRTVAAPTQSSSLNGTTQYYSKASPAGMTFTDDFVVGAWIKLSSYPPSGLATIISRYNATSGFVFGVNNNGQLTLTGYNTGSSNLRQVFSLQSIPLNKWVHVAGQLDMSSFTVSPTTCYFMIDGADIPANVFQSGTNPIALVQAGNLEIGSQNAGTNLFTGKIAQPFVSSAKITQTNTQALISQGLTSALITANSIVSAYSLSNDITDLNTTNANNLTANGSVLATNADSPFGGQANGSISNVLDYGIIQSAIFSTNTTIVVQVPEGCAIPTSGGITAAAYSSTAIPYGFPKQKRKWEIDMPIRSSFNVVSPAATTWYNIGNIRLTCPVGEWDLEKNLHFEGQGSGYLEVFSTFGLATNTEGDFTTKMGAGNNLAVASYFNHSSYQPVSVATPTNYYLNVYTSTTNTNNIVLTSSAPNASLIRLRNAYL